MGWDTGRIIAVLVILLLIAAIVWFMTRAGRKRAAARYAEAQGRPHATGDAHGHSHGGVHAHGGDAARRDDPSGTAAPDAPRVETYGSGAAGGTLGVSALAATGVGAAALGAAVSAARDDERSETDASLDRATGGRLDASANDSADDSADDSAGDGDRARFDPAVDGHDDAARGTSSGGPRAVRVDTHSDGITSSENDRPRFDASIDGHPTPEREPARAASARADSTTNVDAVEGEPPVAFSAPNVELKETGGALRSQGGGEAVADVAPGSPGAPERGPAPAGASVSDPAPTDRLGPAPAAPAAPAASEAAGNEALTGARASRLGVSAEPGAPEIGTDGPERSPAATVSAPHGAEAEGLYETEPTGTREPEGPVAFSAPNVPLSSIESGVASEGSGRAVPDVAPGRPSDRTPDSPMPADVVADADAADGAKGSATTGSVVGTVAKVAAGAAVVAAAGAAVGAVVRSRSDDRTGRSKADDDGAGGSTVDASGSTADAGDWSSRASTNVAVDARGAPAADHGPGVPAVSTREGAATGRGAGGGITSDGSWASDDDDGRHGGTARDGNESGGGADVSGVSAARIHPAGNDAQQGMGETVPLVDKAPSTDPAAPVPADDVAVRRSAGDPPAVNTSAGADVADAGPRDDRPDAERANLPDPATAGGLDALRPAPSTGASTGRGLEGLPDAGPALAGDFVPRSGDAAHDVREMLKTLNLRESDASRLDVSAEEYRALREGRGDAVPADRLRALRDRLAGMMA